MLSKSLFQARHWAWAGVVSICTGCATSTGSHPPPANLEPPPALSETQSVDQSAEPPPGIKQSTIAGQYDVLEGTAIQFEGRRREDAPETASYRWQIVVGSGGHLLEADQRKVTLIAPAVAADVESFVLQLTTAYASGASSIARININVHRRRSALVREARGRSASYYGPGPWLGFSFGFNYGWAWRYPVYVPVYVPYPGDELGPEELEYLDPTPLPASDPIFDDIAAAGLMIPELSDTLDEGYSQDALDLIESPDYAELLEDSESLEALAPTYPADMTIEPVLDGYEELPADIPTETMDVPMDFPDMDFPDVDIGDF